MTNQIIFPQIQELTFAGLLVIAYVWNENGREYMKILETIETLEHRIYRGKIIDMPGIN
jgi:hypothetical protein